MNFTTAVFIFFLVFSSCCTMTRKSVNDNDIKIPTSDDVSNIEMFVAKETYKILTNVTEISVYAIEKNLIEGTENEYSNKSTFIKKLDEDSANELVAVLTKDSSYDWENYKKEIPLEPKMQLIIKNEKDQVNIMYDPQSKNLSFFTLNGPNTIPTTDSLHQKLLSIL